MANFQQFISTFDTENTKGSQFEKFCKWFLENDPVWKSRVDKVWLFKDFPDRWSDKDVSVDLAFRDVDNKYGGRVLGDIHLQNDKRISQIILKEGFAVPYDGGKKFDWCS